MTRSNRGFAPFVVVTLTGAPIVADRQVPDATPPAFEVASVKLNQSGATRPGPQGLVACADCSFFQASPSGLVVFTNYPLRSLIVFAYGIERPYEQYTPDGGPAGVLSTRFDINAKVGVDPAAPQSPETEVAVRTSARLMLRTLLADRFKLRTHTETRQVPVFALVVAREGQLGPELRRSKHDCDAYRAARRAGSNDEAPRDAKNRPLCTQELVRAPAADGATGVRPLIAMVDRFAGPLAGVIQSIQTAAGRPIIEATGLTGNFEWQITRGLTGDSPFPTILTAVPEQLGLRLESRTAPVDVIVIDAVELPTPD
jgi:uncharacterized protein (TIGR03435 family)